MPLFSKILCFILAAPCGLCPPLATEVEVFQMVMQWAEKLTIAGMLLLVIVTYFMGLWYGKREFQALEKRLADEIAASTRWRKLALELAGITEGYARIMDPEAPPSPVHEAIHDAVPSRNVPAPVAPDQRRPTTVAPNGAKPASGVGRRDATTPRPNRPNH